MKPASHFGLRLISGLFVVGVILAPASRTYGQLSELERADLVLQLLPEDARDGAAILLRDESEEKRYRDGTGPFVCVSDASASDRLSMVCHHHVLQERLRFERQLARETGLQGAAFRAHLCSEVADRGLDVPKGAMEITASLARGESGGLPSEMTVYHLLWLPHETTESTGVTDVDPGEGKPWLHQAGTCGAHVMWSERIAVPVNDL